MATRYGTRPETRAILAALRGGMHPLDAARAFGKSASYMYNLCQRLHIKVKR